MRLTGPCPHCGVQCYLGEGCAPRHEAYEEDLVSYFWRKADGVAHRVDRIEAIGNGQVPQVAALAWCMLLKVIQEQSKK